MYSDNEIRHLVAHYGQGYDYVIFRGGDSLLICCADINFGLSSSAAGADDLEQIVETLSKDNKTVRVVFYTNVDKMYALPDLDELATFQSEDY